MKKTIRINQKVRRYLIRLNVFDSKLVKKGELKMAGVAKSHKACASCSYWAGDRKTSPGKEMAIVSSNEKGKCTHNSGPSRNMNMGWQGTCSKWEAWNQLK